MESEFGLFELRGFSGKLTPQTAEFLKFETPRYFTPASAEVA